MASKIYIIEGRNLQVKALTKKATAKRMAMCERLFRDEDENQTCLDGCQKKQETCQENRGNTEVK